MGVYGCEDGSGLGTSHARKQVDAERILRFLEREGADAARPVINEQMHPTIIIMLRPQSQSTSRDVQRYREENAWGITSILRSSTIMVCRSASLDLDYRWWQLAFGLGLGLFRFRMSD